MTITTKAFWDYAGDRAMRSFAQAIIVLAGAQVQPFNILHADWLVVLGVALGMGVVSVCTSIISYTPAPAPADPPTVPVPPAWAPEVVTYGHHEAPESS